MHHAPFRTHYEQRPSLWKSVKARVLSEDRDRPAGGRKPDAGRYPTPTGFAMKGEGTWVGGFPGVPLGGASFTRVEEPDGSTRTVMVDGGENLPDGLAVWYRLAEDVEPEDLRVEIADRRGRVLRTIFAASQPGRPEPDSRPGVTAGLQHVVWDLRIEPALEPPEDDGSVEPVTSGPRVPPGDYRVRVVARDVQQEAPVRVVADPRLAAPASALDEQYELLVQIRDLLAQITAAVGWARGQLSDGELDEQRRTVLTAADRALMGTNKTHGDELKHPPGLVAKIVLLPEIVVELSDTVPTQAVRDVWQNLHAEADTQLSVLRDHGYGPMGDTDEHSR